MDGAVLGGGLRRHQVAAKDNLKCTSTSRASLERIRDHAHGCMMCKYQQVLFVHMCGGLVNYELPCVRLGALDETQQQLLLLLLLIFSVSIVLASEVFQIIRI